MYEKTMIKLMSVWKVFNKCFRGQVVLAELRQEQTLGFENLSSTSLWLINSYVKIFCVILTPSCLFKLEK